MTNEGRAVLVVSSHVARGAVGNRAMVLALETLGIPVWAVPTVILPWHPGHGRATRIVPAEEHFSSFMRDIACAPWASEICAVLSGYLGDAEQAIILSETVMALKEVNPELIYACDPVIGDSGGLYVAEDVAIAIRDHLLPIADLATPNRFELSWLADDMLTSIEDIVECAARLGPPRVLVTSSFARADGCVANLFWNGQTQTAILAENRLYPKVPSGTGDLTAALFLASILQGRSEREALQKASAAVFDTLRFSVEQGSDELLLEKAANMLKNPVADVTTQILPSVITAKGRGR